MLLLKDAPHYWHGHPSFEELERRVPVVARLLGNTDGTFARILRDLGFASTRPVVRNIRAPLDIIRPVPAKRPHWRPLCLSQEKVSGNVSLLDLLQFTRDLAQHNRPVVPVLCDENIHYRICKMTYGEKGQDPEALAPAKRKSTGGEPAPKKKKTASKTQAAKSVTGAESDESDGDEEEESKEEEEEEAQVSQGKAAKEVAAKPRSEETGARAPFKQPVRQSQPRSEPARPAPKGKTSVAKALGSKMQTVPKKK